MVFCLVDHNCKTAGNHFSRRTIYLKKNNNKEKLTVFE